MKNYELWYNANKVILYVDENGERTTMFVDEQIANQNKLRNGQTINRQDVIKLVKQQAQNHFARKQKNG